jgi:hypothetical protein
MAGTGLFAAVLWRRSVRLHARDHPRHLRSSARATHTRHAEPVIPRNASDVRRKSRRQAAWFPGHRCTAEHPSGNKDTYGIAIRKQGRKGNEANLNGSAVC